MKVSQQNKILIILLIIQTIVLLILNKFSIHKPEEEPDPPHHCGYLTFSVTGGLGNQLFQFASSFAIAQDSLRRLVLPKSLKLKNYFQLERFRDEETTDIKQFERQVGAFGIPAGFEGRTLAKLKDQDCNPNSILVLMGYLQSWKYFHHYWEHGILKKFLTFKPEIMEAAKQVILNVTKDLREKNGVFSLVGIHARRGDFVNNKNKVPANKEYIEMATNYYRRQFAQTTDGSNHRVLFLGVGDDYKWNLENFPKSSDVIVLPPSEDAAFDLCILSFCNSTIMTTGTFGWWAGLLAGGKTLYMKTYGQPNSTFVNHDMYPKDHFLPPPKWIAM